MEWNSLPADLRLVDNCARFRRLLKGHNICLAEAAAPSDSVLFLGAVYKYTYLLTYVVVEYREVNHAPHSSVHAPIFRSSYMCAV